MNHTINGWIASALRKTGRKHGKRHSTNSELSRLASTKARVDRLDRLSRDAEFRSYKDRVQAYWRGESDHP